MTTNVSLVILSAEQFVEMTTAMQHLREHAAGYDRLRVVHDQLKARCTSLEVLCRQNLQAMERQHTYRLNADVEVHQLKQQMLELGRKNIALAAEAEGKELAEKQLAAADQRIAELEAALMLRKLPEESRNAAWREAA